LFGERCARKRGVGGKKRWERKGSLELRVCKPRVELILPGIVVENLRVKKLKEDWGKIVVNLTTKRGDFGILEDWETDH